MEKVKVCECCGAKLVEYKHVLNKGLVHALFELAKQDKPVHLSTLDLTRNQWTNFQKLRYWNLVYKEMRDDGSCTGNWYLTSDGWDFIWDRSSMAKHAWTYRGETIRLDGDRVYFSEIYDRNYRERVDYARDAQVHLGI